MDTSTPKKKESLTSKKKADPIYCHICRDYHKGHEMFRMHIMKKHRPSSQYYEGDPESDSSDSEASYPNRMRTYSKYNQLKVESDENKDLFNFESDKNMADFNQAAKTSECCKNLNDTSVSPIVHTHNTRFQKNKKKGSHSHEIKKVSKQVNNKTQLNVNEINHPQSMPDNYTNPRYVVNPIFQQLSSLLDQPCPLLQQPMENLEGNQSKENFIENQPKKNFVKNQREQNFIENPPKMNFGGNQIEENFGQNQPVENFGYNQPIMQHAPMINPITLPDNHTNPRYVVNPIFQQLSSLIYQPSPLLQQPTENLEGNQPQENFVENQREQNFIENPPKENFGGNQIEENFGQNQPVENFGYNQPIMQHAPMINPITLPEFAFNAKNVLKWHKKLKNMCKGQIKLSPRLVKKKKAIRDVIFDNCIILGINTNAEKHAVLNVYEELKEMMDKNVANTAEQV